MRYGGAAPAELVAMQLAKEWGTPPWEIYDHDDSTWWAVRWSLYQDELDKARQKP